MNLFGIPENDEYCCKSKMRLHDASVLAHRLQCEFTNPQQDEGEDGGEVEEEDDEQEVARRVQRAREQSEVNIVSSFVNVVLDLGCGSGNSTLELAARFPSSR